MKEFEHYFLKKREADKDLKLTPDIQEILNDIMRSLNFSRLIISNINTSKVKDKIENNEALKMPSYRSGSTVMNDLCQFNYNQTSFRSCKKFNKQKNETSEMMTLLKESLQKELMKNVSTSIRNINKNQEKLLNENKKIILSLSNKNFERCVQLDGNKRISINNFKKKIDPSKYLAKKEENNRGNINILNNEFIKKSLQKIDQIGFIQHQNDINEIAHNMKLKQKSLRNFELDLVESVKNTTNLITEVNRTREAFRETKFVSELKKTKLVKHQKLKKSFCIDRNNITNFNVNLREKLKFRLIDGSSNKDLIDKSTSVNFNMINQPSNKTNKNSLIKRNDKMILIRSNIIQEFN